MKSFQNSIQIFITYIFIFYLVPLTFYFYDKSIFEREFIVSINLSETIPIIFLVIFAYLTTFFIFSSSTRRVSYAIARNNFFNSYLFQLIKGAIFLTAAIYFFLILGASYRQTGSGVSSYGSLGYISLFSIFFLKTEVIFDFICFLNGQRSNTLMKVIKFFGIFIPLALFVNASFDIPFIVLAFLLYFPLVKSDMVLKIDFFKNLILFLFVSILGLFLVLLVGFGNKIGFEVFISNIFTYEFIIYVLEYLAWRVSVFFASIQAAIDNLQNGYLSSDYTFSKLIDLSIDRQSALFDFSAYQNEIRTIERLNNLHLFPQSLNFNEGTSPGLIAGLLYSSSVVFSSS